jgi:ureidoglycolate lyase
MASVPISTEPLTARVFAEFGSVIQNPLRSGEEHEGVEANQGTARKYADISRMENYYHLALSRKPSRVSMSMFACLPRKCRSEEDATLLDIKVFERHPYTTQTFIPLGLSHNDPNASYVVVVAPTLPPTSQRHETLNRPKPYPTPEPKAKTGLWDIFSRTRPSPFTNESGPPGPGRIIPNSKSRLPKGPGLPDVSRTRAFVATGDQAVMYAAGTWHSPMIVIGQKPVDFLVLQFVNGVGVEDCQEIELGGESGSMEKTVTVSIGSRSRNMKAKL